MSQLRVPGSHEVLNDAEKLFEQKISAEVERRLRGLSPEEFFRHFSAEDRLRGLTAAERARLRKLLMKDEG